MLFLSFCLSNTFLRTLRLFSPSRLEFNHPRQLLSFEEVPTIYLPAIGYWLPVDTQVLTSIWHAREASTADFIS